MFLMNFWYFNWLFVYSLPLLHVGLIEQTEQKKTNKNKQKTFFAESIFKHSDLFLNKTYFLNLDPTLCHTSVYLLMFECT